MTEFPFISGTDIATIENRQFIRIETDKAQEIVIALDKSGIPFSARYGETEMVLTYDGSFKEQVEDIIAKAKSGEYEALLRDLQLCFHVNSFYFLSTAEMLLGVSVFRGGHCQRHLTHSS